MLKFSLSLKENIKDIQKALELMLSVPSRAYDNTFLNSIEGYRGNISKIGRLLLHEWWTVIDKEGKSHERYLFLFKSRLLICKVRKISDKRSIFVLQEIIKIPDCVVEEDSLNGQIKFTAKPNAKDAQHLPICLKPHNDNKDLLKKWYTEICAHIDKEVTLQEHKADDLRIDSTQILQETTLNLPNKAEAYNPDTSVKASDVAKDYFLTKEEKERYQAEYQELLRLEQESIERYNKTKLQSYQTVQKTSVSATETSQHSEIQQRTETISSVAQRTAGLEQKVSTQTQSLEEKERILVRNDNIVEEQRSSNVTCSQETRTEVAAIRETRETVQNKATKQESEPKIETPKAARESPKLTKEPEIESPKTVKEPVNLSGKESPKPAKVPEPQTDLPKATKEPEPKRESPKPVQQPLEPKRESPKIANKPEPKRESPKLTREPEPKKEESPKPKRDSPPKKSSPEAIKSTAVKQEIQQDQREEVVKTATITTETLTETLPSSHPVEEINEDLGKIATPTKAYLAFTPEPLPVPQITVTQDIIPRIHKPIELKDIVGYQESIRQAAGGDQNPSGSGGQQNVYNISDSASLAQWNSRLYNIQMGRGGAAGDGSDEPPQPPMPPHSVRMPGFFQPLPRISYETSIEILIVKAPPPPPPPPITLIPRVVVLNDALELKSQNFLEGIYETDSFDTSLRTAKRKIKSIKSTVLKSKDSTKYAVDTVKKATARDFLHIFTPPIKQKRPIYEIVEEPSRASDVEDDYSESYYGELQSEIREHSVARTEDHLSVTSRRHYESKMQKEFNVFSVPPPPHLCVSPLFLCYCCQRKMFWIESVLRAYSV